MCCVDERCLQDPRRASTPSPSVARCCRAPSCSASQFSPSWACHDYLLFSSACQEAEQQRIERCSGRGAAARWRDTDATLHPPSRRPRFCRLAFCRCDGDALPSLRPRSPLGLPSLAADWISRRLVVVVLLLRACC